MPANVSRETPAPWTLLPDQEILNRAARLLGVDLTGAQTERLLAFLHDLRAWNRKINLIGPSSFQEAIILHLADSLAILPFIPDGNLTFLDIGSGGGLPGAPLKIVRPDWGAVLVEATGKKAVILKQILRKLELSRIEVINERLSIKVEGPYRFFDLITARAVSSLADLVNLAGPRLKENGLLAAYKGPVYKKEAALAAPAAAGQNLVLVRSHEYTLPFIERRRSLVFYARRPAG